MDLCTALASKVVKATSAAAHAVTRCDATLLHVHARRLVADAGNDDAAALAALDACVRCDAASLAALEAATCCESAAAEAGEHHRAAATRAAEAARVAAARCDEDGAAAASQAANAFADICVAACGDAERLTLAAGEAAARCVVSRDDAATALLVAQEAATWRRRKAYRESADSHKEARKDAVAEALAVREGSVRCAAASRRAVLAASIARKIASRCEATGAYGAMATAATARAAADRCVAARIDAPAAGDDDADAAADLAVPLADAAALKAREAASVCDLALADPRADAEKEFVDKMRGWLMTVAALFVGIAFQALLHPPDGMSFHRCDILSKNAWKWKESSAAPAPAPSSAATAVNVTSPREAWRLFVLFPMDTEMLPLRKYLLQHAGAYLAAGEKQYFAKTIATAATFRPAMSSSMPIDVIGKSHHRY
ncbi:uncharacterized protein LOC123409630 [Hordeum vulgare subsp. vulgare]|uniref:uncharacterized protein LOC123409630 n=1 Tax=Hordeum vulgare subsp. vulgare TaxID=112509 RepID=UPI001D1A40BC|nr:uncharacterized protein LOC123409630 [Hordeum vulgare subsp. vulgare]